MKLTRILTLSALGATSLAAMVASSACSSSSTTVTTPPVDAGSDTSTSKTDAATDGPGASTLGTPPKPGGAATKSTEKHNFAVHNLYLGDSNADAPTFTANPQAWQNFGYNIDGLVTTATSTDVCSPYTKGDTTAQVDGPNGVDNAFGSVIAAMLSGFGVSSKSISTDVAEGHFTLEVNVTGLDGTATQTATGLSGALYGGDTYPGTPPLTGSNFSVTDDWPVNGSLLNAPGTAVSDGSQVNFGSAYVTNGTFVSGAQAGTIELNLTLAGNQLALAIHDGVITMPVTKDATTGQFSSKVGIVSGVLLTSELLGALDGILVKANLCSASAIAVALIEGAQDLILTNGTVSNKAGTPCNAISIGLAFDADEIAQPDTVAPPAADAGAPATCTGSGSGTGTNGSDSGTGSTGSGSGSTPSSGSGSGGGGTGG